MVTSSGYGIYAAGAGQQQLFKGNRIHDLFNSPTGTSAFYGIYFSANDGTAVKPNLIINNVLYNLNTNGSQYCIYNIGSDYCLYYNNTLYIDNPSATAGLVYGFYQSTLASGIELKNNIFSISKGGSAAKYALYFATATTIPVSNYNDLYVNTAVVGTGVNNIAYHTVAQTTLAAWKAYSSGIYDQNSLSVDPNIANAAIGNLKPNAALLNNAGTPLTLVTDDITGAARSATPDIGAYEFAPATDDAAITAIVSFARIPVFSALVDRSNLTVVNKKDKCYTIQKLEDLTSELGVSFQRSAVEELIYGHALGFSADKKYYMKKGEF